MVCQNYRPISLMCSLRKLYEICIDELIHEKISPKLSPLQYGFKNKSSTISNLLSSYYTIYKSLDNRAPIDLISIDFSKAFDRVDFNVLLLELSKFGLSPTFLRAINQLLINRYQTVTIRGRSSTPLSISSGMPQGSVLSPLLFNVYLNRIFDINLNGQLSAYADDLKLIGSPQLNLQSDLDQLMIWSHNYGLDINVDKCAVLHFGKKNPNCAYSINGVCIKAVKVFRDLGVLIDVNLNFRGHLKQLQNHCFRLIGLLFRLFKSKNASLYIKFFELFILPKIDYCSALFINNNKYSVANVEKIQRRFSKRLYIRIYHDSSVPDYDSRIKLFNLHMLRNRFAYIHILTTYKLINKLMLGPDFIHFSKRVPFRILLPSIKTALYNLETLSSITF